MGICHIVSGRSCSFLVIHYFWLLQSFLLLSYRFLVPDGRGLVKTSHLGLTVPKSSLSTRSSSEFLHDFPSTERGALSDDWVRRSSMDTAQSHQESFYRFVLFAEQLPLCFPWTYGLSNLRFCVIWAMPAIGSIFWNGTWIHAEHGWLPRQCLHHYCCSLTCRQVTVLDLSLQLSYCLPFSSGSPQGTFQYYCEHQLVGGRL